MSRETKPIKGRVFPTILPEIRSLIETSRHRVAVTANLALVNLNWNIGRIITQDIQKNEKRAGYGEQLIEELARELGKEYGPGYSAKNLWDMKRFFSAFKILQALPGEFRDGPIRPPLLSKSTNAEILQAPPGESSKAAILQALSVESSDRIAINLGQHFHLGWTHYRTLLGIEDIRKRNFYFDQSSSQRWSTRELERQINGALFERVALSRNTRKLAALEKEKGPPETVSYEDIFKDPYLLDFLGLKGAYSEKDLEAAIIRNLEQFLTESLTTGVAGGLISPIRAILLAPLKGKFETLFLQIFTADQWPICYHSSLMLFTLLTCPPKRGHSDPCPIGLQSTRSPLDPGYISSLSPHSIPPYSHNTPEPKSDAP